MNENEIQFRTATFGGFQKQDVLDYLERNAREQTEKLTALQKELDASESARTEAGETLAANQIKIDRLTKENRRLSDSLAEQERKQSETEEKLTALTAQVHDLSEQVERLTPGAIAYEGLKDRAAGIELSAHSRAHEIEAEAQAKAKRTQAEVDGWFVRLQSAYDRMKADLNAALSHVGEELARVEKSLEGISGELDAHDSALREMKRSAEAVTGPKAPQPLPLEEVGAREG